jgi:hypothetical protein
MRIVYLKRNCGEEHIFIHFDYPCTLGVGDIVIEKTFNEPMTVTRVYTEMEKDRYNKIEIFVLFNRS